VKALKKAGKDEKYDFKILNSVIESNSAQKTILLPKIEKYFNNDLKGKTIAIWGLAFKPETDDISEAPSIDMMEAVLDTGAKLQVFDPEAMPIIENRFGNKLEYSNSMYAALEKADALLICTEWSIFRTPDYERLKKLLKNPVVFDGRNLYNVNDMESEGFTYVSVGRKSVNL